MGHELITTDNKPFQRYWLSAVHETLPFPHSRHSAQSRYLHLDGCPSYLPSHSVRDSIGRRRPADQCCSSVLPQCLPCTPYLTWDNCPIRRTSSTFIQFQSWSNSRHSAINNIISRSHDTAGHHSILESVGLGRVDGRRPDGVTPFPFKCSKSLAWDAT